MQIIIRNRSEKDLEQCDYQDRMTVTIDGKQAFSVHDGEPEDATLGRDFNDCTNIPDMLKLAHAAGTKGEPLEITYETLDED